MNNATVSKIEVKNVFKIFGNRAKDALAMVGQGKTKDQVLSETGCVVGVNDLSLSIDTGEIFVIMGLSGSGKSTPNARCTGSTPWASKATKTNTRTSSPAACVSEWAWLAPWRRTPTSS
jgi:ABC-type glutathione transport system ATPase component